jgi:hypothetical protein
MLKIIKEWVRKLTSMFSKRITPEEYERMRQQETAYQRETAPSTLGSAHQRELDASFLDYFERLAPKSRAFLIWEEVTGEHFEAVAQDISDLTPVWPLEKAGPPSTDDMKTITELRDMIRDLQKRFNSATVTTGNTERH